MRPKTILEFHTQQCRRDDRAMTLSQIVHPALRCRFEPDGNFDKQRRLIAYAPIHQPACV
jgi:hypothetical protein